MQNRKMILFLLMIGISFTGCAVSSSSSGGGGGGTGETASLTVYFKKPDSWTGAYIYYWPNGPAWTSSPAMEDVGNNWYRYTIQGRKESWLLFKDKAGDTTTKTLIFTAIVPDGTGPTETGTTITRKSLMPGLNVRRIPLPTRWS